MVDYKNFSDDDDPVRLAFKKIFGDMYLSESETALRIFEYGYKEGLEAGAKGAEADRVITIGDYIKKLGERDA